MWVLRRATNPLRNKGFTVGIAQACFANSEVSSGLTVTGGGDTLKSQAISDSFPKRVYQTEGVPLKLFTGRCSFGTLPVEESSGEEDGFSGLGASDNVIRESNLDVRNENESSFESELSDNEVNFEEPSKNELELSNAESDKSKKGKRNELLEVIIAAPHLSVHSVLDKWAAEGKKLDLEEILQAKAKLRLRRMLVKALELSEWLLASKQFDIVEKDYASHLNLIAKVRGPHKAESFIEKIPESLRGEMIYRMLLANYVSAKKMEKAEEVFKKMKELGFSISTFACNQLLILYKMFNRKKMPEVLSLMEKEKVQPNLYTYKLLIEIKGRSRDITAVDQMVKKMKAEGIELDTMTKTTLARCYINWRVKEKAEAILKEIEGGGLEENRWASRYVLPLYAELGMADEVRRVWKVCESHPRLAEYLAAIEAWGKLDRVEEAEAVFEGMLKLCKDTQSKHYLVLLDVYVKNKMLAKGELLVKRMSESGCPMGPLTWDALVKLYVDAGDVEKAESILQKAVQKYPMKPLHRSYVTLLKGYAVKGDVRNAERCFRRMIEFGHSVRHWEFDTLLQAYVCAKIPAYGFEDRMKAHNVFPDKALASKLYLLDQLDKSLLALDRKL